MATMLLAQGVPMITAGDELGRSQGGNNNVYCQDNEIAWLDWSMDEESKTMLAATQRLLRIRKDFLSAQPSSYPTRGGQSFIHWFGSDGQPMSGEGWKNPHQRVLTMLLGSPDGTMDGLVVFNTGITDEEVVLPANPRFTAAATVEETVDLTAGPTDADSDADSDAEPVSAESADVGAGEAAHDAADEATDAARAAATDDDLVAAGDAAADTESESIAEIPVPRPYLLRMTTEEPSKTDDGEPTFRLPRSGPETQAGESVLVKANTVHLYSNVLGPR